MTLRFGNIVCEMLASGAAFNVDNVSWPSVMCVLSPQHGVRPERLPRAFDKSALLQSLLLMRISGCAAFGTYVLAATDVECRVKELEKEVVLFNPKKEVLVLVIITWVFQILTL